MNLQRNVIRRRWISFYESKCSLIVNTKITSALIANTLRHSTGPVPAHLGNSGNNSANAAAGKNKKLV